MPEQAHFPLIRTEIATWPIAELVREYGTPLFVYDAALIRRRVKDLAAFDVIRYAQKACSNLAILDLIRREGAAIDAVSAFEIRRALAAGYSRFGSPHPIVYTADIFDSESLALVVESGIHVNCGSADMIDQFGAAAPGRAITLRINPGFGHGHVRKTNTGGPQSKHGIWHEQLPDCVDRAAKYGLRITGLHMHIGSGSDFEHLSQVCAAMEAAVAVAGEDIDTLSTGGGLPTPYRDGETGLDVDAFFRAWDASRKRVEDRLGRKITLEVEPGRYLVAESGTLITEIRAVKRQQDNLFYLVDAGFNNLARPVLYGAYHPIAVVPREGGGERPLQDVIVGGPLCESGDIFTQEEGGFVSKRPLPQASVGDYLALECAGAYGAVMGSNYNSKPMAPEVLIEGGESRVIRRRQSFEELIAGERPSE